jgi:hypothetical protein
MHGVFSDDIWRRSLKKIVHVASSGARPSSQDVICGVGKQSRNGGPIVVAERLRMIMAHDGTAMATCRHRLSAHRTVG